MSSTEPRAQGSGTPAGHDVELARRFWSCVGARDVDAARELTAADVTIRPMMGFLFTRAEFHGHAGLAQWHAELTGPWDRFQAIVEDTFELEDGVLAVVRLVAWRGGQPLDARVATDCVMRDGRIAALVDHDADDIDGLRRRRFRRPRRRFARAA